MLGQENNPNVYMPINKNEAGFTMISVLIMFTIIIIMLMINIIKTDIIVNPATFLNYIYHYHYYNAYLPINKNEAGFTMISVLIMFTIIIIMIIVNIIKTDIMVNPASFLNYVYHYHYYDAVFCLFYADDISNIL